MPVPRWPGTGVAQKMPTRKEESEELKEAKQKIMDAVFDILIKTEGNYIDIEEAIQDAIAVAENRYMWCDIHG